MKLDVAIRDVRDAELTLARELNALRERHRADHDVFHLTATLLGIAHANLDRLAPHGARYGVTIDHDDAPAEQGSDARDRDPGLLLLHDLRELHLRYAEASINYVILGQGAQAARDRELLEATSKCHEQTLRGMKWTVTRIKTAAPQVLSG